MKIPVTCDRCGKRIGSQRQYSYGGPNNDDYIDYGEPEPNEYYGGRHDGAYYCDGCYHEIVMNIRSA